MIYHQLHNSKKNFHYNSFIYGEGSTWYSHFHTSYELIYIIQGHMDVSLNGKVISLAAHEMLLLSPNAVHSFSVGRGSSIWVGVFSTDHIDAFFKKYSSVQFGKFTCEGESEKMLLEKLFVCGKPDRYLRMAYLYTVCDACSKNAEHMNTNNEQKFMNDVIKYISENLDNDISMRELAAELGYEYHYFSALFNQCFGMNFKKFLNVYKVEQACALLSESDRSVISVYKECGFSSMRNFNRVFKELCGYTPSEYKTIQGEN